MATEKRVSLQSWVYNCDPPRPRQYLSHGTSGSVILPLWTRRSLAKILKSYNNSYILRVKCRPFHLPTTSTTSSPFNVITLLNRRLPFFCFLSSVSRSFSLSFLFMFFSCPRLCQCFPRLLSKMHRSIRYHQSDVSPTLHAVGRNTLAVVTVVIHRSVGYHQTDVSPTLHAVGRGTFADPPLVMDSLSQMK